jgi:hypothetical protein
MDDDWLSWHDAYDDDSPLRHRLLAVQARIREFPELEGDTPVR